MKKLNVLLLKEKSLTVGFMNFALWFIFLIVLVAKKNTEIETFWIKINVVIYGIGYFGILFFPLMLISKKIFNKNHSLFIIDFIFLLLCYGFLIGLIQLIIIVVTDMKSPALVFSIPSIQFSIIVYEKIQKLIEKKNEP